MDYRKLLAKYILHVNCCERLTYLDSYRREDSGNIFSDAEWEALAELEIEALFNGKKYE